MSNATLCYSNNGHTITDHLEWTLISIFNTRFHLKKTGNRYTKKKKRKREISGTSRPKSLHKLEYVSLCKPDGVARKDKRRTRAFAY